MSASTKLSTAVKALAYLSDSYPEPRNSDQIAGSIEANASKIRRILSLLNKNRIVKSARGSNGGFLLAKDASKISLQEIYCSIEDRKAFHLDVRQTVNGKSDSAKINVFFLDLFSEIQVDIEAKMSKITLKQIVDQTKKT